MASLEGWIRDFPVVTRTWIAGALLITAGCSLDLITPFSLYFSSHQILYKYQFHRLFTSYLFFSREFNFHYLFYLYSLCRYSRSLEEGNGFRGHTADFCYMILFGWICITLLAPILHLDFLGSSLTFMIVYIWSRRNIYARLNFLGIFTFNAPYLPYVELAFSWILGHDGIQDIVGIAVGHCYYFLTEVYPKMTGIYLLRTPQFFHTLFDTPTYQQQHTNDNTNNNEGNNEGLNDGNADADNDNPNEHPQVLLPQT